MRNNSVLEGDERWFPRPADIIAYNLLEAMRGPSCPICSLMRRGEERFIFSLFWENVNAPSIRKRLRDSLGFCKTHTRAVRQAVNQPWVGPLGVAILYRDFARTILERVRRPVPIYARPFARPERRALRLLTPKQRCWICERADETEHAYLSTLTAGLDASPALRDVYADSLGLCLAHTDQALDAVRTEKARRVLAAVAQRRAQGENAEALRGFLLRLCGTADITPHTNLDMRCVGCKAEGAAEQDYLQALAPVDLVRIWKRLCPEHRILATEWALRRYANAREFAQDLLEQVLSERGAERYDCPLCVHTRNAAQTALLAARNDLASTACLPHIRLALQAAASVDVPAWIASLAQRLDHMAADLGEIIRKSDYRFSHEPLGDEQDAWLRALVLFGGETVA